MVKIARIRVVSTNTNSLSLVCNEIKDIATKAKVRVKGPIALPTKKVIQPVRKSPCGNGSKTWEHYEMKIHKRIIELDADSKALQMLLRITTPKDIQIGIKII